MKPTSLDDFSRFVAYNLECDETEDENTRLDDLLACVEAVYAEGATDEDDKFSVDLTTEAPFERDTNDKLLEDYLGGQLYALGDYVSIQGSTVMIYGVLG